MSLMPAHPFASHHLRGPVSRTLHCRLLAAVPLTNVLFPEKRKTFDTPKKGGYVTFTIRVNVVSFPVAFIQGCM